MLKLYPVLFALYIEEIVIHVVAMYDRISTINCPARGNYGGLWWFRNSKIATSFVSRKGGFTSFYSLRHGDYLVLCL